MNEREAHDDEKDERPIKPASNDDSGPTYFFLN